MEIQIETNYTPLIVACDDLPDGVQLTRKPVMERRDISSAPLAIGILSFASGVSASLVASWIYDKIKNVNGKPEFVIKINHKEMRQIDLASLTETIEREIEISKGRPKPKNGATEA